MGWLPSSRKRAPIIQPSRNGSTTWRRRSVEHRDLGVVQPGRAFGSRRYAVPLSATIHTNQRALLTVSVLNGNSREFPISDGKVNGDQMCGFR